MNAFKRFMVAMLAVAAVMSASAQFRFGVKVGTEINSIKSLDLGSITDNFSAENRAGFTGGLTAEFTVPVLGLGFDISAMYVHRTSGDLSQIGEEFKDKKTGGDYIEIPLNLKYKLQIPAISSIIVPYAFAGPSVAFLTSKDALTNAFKNKKVDVAVNVGLGLELVKHLQIGASYGFGLSNALEKVGVASDLQKIDGKNKYWTVTAAYLF